MIVRRKFKGRPYSEEWGNKIGAKMNEEVKAGSGITWEDVTHTITRQLMQDVGLRIDTMEGVAWGVFGAIEYRVDCSYILMKGEYEHEYRIDRGLPRVYFRYLGGMIQERYPSILLPLLWEHLEQVFEVFRKEHNEQAG